MIAKILGALWILDGLLQFQPQMFGPAFVSNVLAPVMSGQPGLMSAIVGWGIQLWNTNTIVTDTAAALLQIAIGVLILFPLSSKRCRTGLWLSIIWGVVVWLCGEGAGQLLTGGASFYTGAPGAVVIYILIAFLLLFPKKITAQGYPKIAGLIMMLGALLQLQPSSWSAAGMQSIFMVAMQDPLRIVNILPNFFYNTVGLHPLASNILLALVLFLFGLALILRPSKFAGTIALTFLFFVWWLGQDFGQLSTLFTGTATDPNTAPLIALLILPIFFVSRFSSKETMPIKENRSGPVMVRSGSF